MDSTEQMNYTNISPNSLIVFRVNMKILSWRELARIDAELPASLVDTSTAVSHKYQVSGSGFDSEITSTLRQEMKRSYEEKLKFFDIRTL